MSAASAPDSSLALAYRRPSIIGFHDARDQFVADHVFMGKCDMADTFDACEQPDRLLKTGSLTMRQVDLAGIAGDNHAAVLTKTGEKHFHLHRRGVLRFVEYHRGIRQSASAHEREWRYFDLAPLQGPLDNACIHQIIKRVVDGTQIGIDLLPHVPGKKAKALAGLHGGA